LLEISSPIFSSCFSFISPIVAGGRPIMRFV
jgi:hypothetical protein